MEITVKFKKLEPDRWIAWTDSPCITVQGSCKCEALEKMKDALRYFYSVT